MHTKVCKKVSLHYNHLHETLFFVFWTRKTSDKKHENIAIQEIRMIKIELNKKILRKK